MAANPEQTFCQILERNYTLVRSAMDQAVIAPLLTLQTIEGIAATAQYVVIYSASQLIEALEKQVKKYLDSTLKSAEEAREDFCKVAYNCRALMNILGNKDSLIPSPLLGIFTQEQLDQYLSNYQEFELWVCNRSLQGLIDRGEELIVAELVKQIEKARKNVLDAIDVNELYERYMDILEDYKIYEWLNKFDELAACTLSTCDWASTAGNSKKDYMVKLKISGSAPRFTLVSDIFAEVNEKQSELIFKCDTMLSKLNKPAPNNDTVNKNELV